MLLTSEAGCPPYGCFFPLPCEAREGSGSRPAYAAEGLLLTSEAGKGLRTYEVKGCLFHKLEAGLRTSLRVAPQGNRPSLASQGLRSKGLLLTSGAGCFFPSGGPFTCFFPSGCVRRLLLPVGRANLAKLGCFHSLPLLRKGVAASSRREGCFAANPKGRSNPSLASQGSGKKQP